MSTREPRRDRASALYSRQARALEVHGEHWSGPPELVEAVADVARTHPRARVLDVACGVGGPARRLHALLSCDVVALDANADVVARARSLTPGRAVRFVVASAADLPFPEAGFDQVWCLGALAHFEDPRRFFAEAGRVLAPGGAIALSEGLRMDAAELAFAARAPSPWRPPSRRELAAALSAAGFEDVVVSPWPPELARFEGVTDEALRRDLVAGRLRPHLVAARHRARAKRTSDGDASVKAPRS